MKTPKDFADLYIKGEIYLPIFHSISELIGVYNVCKELSKDKQAQNYKTQIKKAISELKRNKLNALSELNLAPSVENKIYIALYELMQAVLYPPTPVLRIINRETTKKRRTAIKSLEKALEYPFLSGSANEVIKKELDRLKNFDKEKGVYHPIKEVDLYREVRKPTILTGMLGGPVSYRLHKEKMEKFLSTPLKIKEGRPTKFFYKTLQIIVFKYLNEESNIPIGKAKNLTAKIINEYFNKQGFRGMANLTSRDIDNALHSS
ncbi:MAG: hypothetical protein AB1478_05635 [Nitrospirota bacterium]